MVRVTDAGRAAIEGAAPGHVAATRRYFFDLVSDHEVDVLTAVFDRVLANLDRVPGDDEGRVSAPQRR
jgi:hypothetical protein